MNKLRKIVLFSLISLCLYGVWLLKKNYIDTGFTNKKEEREYFEMYVLMQRGLEINSENREILKDVTIEELMKEAGVIKDKNGNYIDYPSFIRKRVNSDPMEFANALFGDYSKEFYQGKNTNLKRTFLSPNVYDTARQYNLQGIDFFPEVVVNKENETIFLTIKDRNSQVVTSTILNYEQLTGSAGHLSFFDKIGLISDSTGLNYFIYDFVTKNKIYYSNLNKYNEGIQLGIYNPYIVNDTLIISDYKFNILKKKRLSKISDNKDNWHVLSIGTEVMSGEVKLIKFNLTNSYNNDLKFSLYNYSLNSDSLYILK